MPLFALNKEIVFPPVTLSEPDGLLAMGGDLSTERLLLAYRSGIFPMADHRDDPEIFWVEPKRRAIIPLTGFHLSRSLARTLRRERFTVTCNTAFAQVMEACAAPRRGNDGGPHYPSHGDGMQDDALACAHSRLLLASEYHLLAAP